MTLKTILRKTSTTTILFTCFSMWGSDKKMLEVPLIWKPASILQEYGVSSGNIAQLDGIKIAFIPFTDSRPEKTIIGENREKNEARIVTTNANVAEFVTEHFKDTFKSLGLSIVEKPEEAKLTLTGAIQKFKVLERDTYIADVRILMSIRSGDTVLWQGTATGRAIRFGRSYKLENYYETLSDSLLEAIARLTNDQVFIQVLAGKVTLVPIP
ncbi:MAG: hypothetical protein IPP78_05540 [Holophagaceae bacterium]|nr:hypothetical protein [Holophagaceae bacterium]